MWQGSKNHNILYPYLISLIIPELYHCLYDELCPVFATIPENKYQTMVVSWCVMHKFVIFIDVQFNLIQSHCVCFSLTPYVSTHRFREDSSFRWIPHVPFTPPPGPRILGCAPLAPLAPARSPRMPQLDILRFLVLLHGLTAPEEKIPKREQLKRKMQLGLEDIDIKWNSLYIFVYI